METYHYEVYTSNPETGEGGWDIETGWVEACNLKHAKARISHTVDHFDCFISVYEANMNKTDGLTITTN